MEDRFLVAAVDKAIDLCKVRGNLIHETHLKPRLKEIVTF